MKAKANHITLKNKLKILDLFSQGKTEQQISDKLRVNKSRVKEYLRSYTVRRILTTIKHTETIYLKELTPGFSYVEVKKIVRF